MAELIRGTAQFEWVGDAEKRLRLFPHVQRRDSGCKMWSCEAREKEEDHRESSWM